MKRGFVFIFALGFFLSSCTRTITKTVSSGTTGGGGTDIGNGGNIMVCKNQPPVTLDIFEAKVLHNRDVDLGDPQENVNEKVHRIINRLPPESGLQYILNNNFYEFSQQHVIKDLKLRKIKDLGVDPKNIAVKRGCHLEQVAIQTAAMEPGKTMYFIDKAGWNKIDNNSRAALILHEIIYSYTISQGAQDSRAARWINGLVMASDLAAPCEIRWVLQDFKVSRGMGFIGYQGNVYVAADTEWHECYVRRGHAVAPAHFTVLGQTIEARDAISNEIRWNVSFDDVGDLQDLLYEGTPTLEYKNVQLHLANRLDLSWKENFPWQDEFAKQPFLPGYIIMSGDHLLKASVEDGRLFTDDKEMHLRGVFYFKGYELQVTLVPAKNLFDKNIVHSMSFSYDSDKKSYHLERYD
jgi:hypothetical protein